MYFEFFFFFFFLNVFLIFAHALCGHVIRYVNKYLIH